METAWRKLILNYASKIICTTPSIAKGIAPYTAKNKFKIIGNGYDEEDFRDIPIKREGKRFRFKYLGLLSERRNIQPFLGAVRTCLDRGIFRAEDVQVQFFGQSYIANEHPLIQKYNLQNIITLNNRQYISHPEAIEEMVQSDCNLLFQPRRYNESIPGKAYEYLRVGNPVLAVVDKDGETARFLSRRSNVFIGSTKDQVISRLSAILSRARARPGPRKSSASPVKTRPSGSMN